jgi:hypothetical protein
VAKPSRVTVDHEKTGAHAPNSLTLADRSVALPEHVRELLDWLIDEELKRWLREEH